MKKRREKKYYFLLSFLILFSLFFKMLQNGGVLIHRFAEQTPVNWQ